MEPGNGDPRITAALAQMAMLRQADVSDLALDLYSAKISDVDYWQLPIIIDACEFIATAERKDGESAFPSYGTLSRVINRLHEEDRRARVDEARDEHRARLHESTQLSDERAKYWLDKIKASAHGVRS